MMVAVSLNWACAVKGAVLIAWIQAILGRHLVGHHRPELLGGRQRLGGSTCHLRAGQHEVDIVRVVAEPIGARWRPLLEQCLIRHCRVDVDLQRVRVAAGPVVDMRRHVDEMARRRHQAAQPIGMRLRAARIGRSFDGVNVEVDGMRVVGIEG